MSDLKNSGLLIPLDHVKVERGVYVGESESGGVDFHVITPTTPGEK